MSEIKTNETVNELESRKNITRPGWPEIGMMVLGFLLVMVATVPFITMFTEPGTPMNGVLLAALSGLAGLGAFYAAYLLRIRSGASFGLKRVSKRWILISVGLGVVVFILGRLAVIVMYELGIGNFDLQASYRAASTAGTLYLIVHMLMIAVLTPLGEEFAFRGVLTNALLRYGPWVSIFGSAIIFATAHGITVAWPLAFFCGIASGYTFYRTRSVWPGVVIHAVTNGLGTLTGVIFTMFFS
ncbi:CPBP family intramembrane glutamic endopeptidase [Aureibacillus halotolerans]|uniref:CAAX prenyl protease 2/Lysostaphin resistance protein A-like domain-containing protein n=1 Tax=Aureibacillus halotolerans TaxID=1508390 RepID=A0A4R6UAU1_9BACI|nr:type II CAAX endopeptidase family protein [Aureibacillus halotolerans]TDQ42173.1 hypothetical protein EV213_102204 [Aureibacillus halotolerans]